MWEEQEMLKQMEREMLKKIEIASADFHHRH
jgi:hypothetical protein